MVLGMMPTVAFAESDNILYENYIKTVDFYEEVSTLFPEVYITGPITFDEYRNLKENNTQDGFDELVLADSFKKIIDDTEYTLYVYEDGSYALGETERVQTRDYVTVTNVSGTQYRVRFRILYLQSGSLWSSASFLVYMLGSYGSYYWSTPSLESLDQIRYYSLGLVTSQTARFQGVMVEYNAMIGDYVDVCNVEFSATVSSYGSISTSYSFPPFF
jgi:hypothetical protein